MSDHIVCLIIFFYIGELEGMEGGEAMVRIHCMREKEKNLFLIKNNKMFQILKIWCS